MRPKTPFFEIGIKNYLYGDRVLELAVAADAAAIKYDIDVLLITPYTEIRRVAERTKRLIVLAPYMDTLKPGRGMADVLPEALFEAGARGVVINHCERPIGLAQIKRTIDRARELGMLSFVCADSIEEACAVAQLHPDIINPEPPDRIGTSGNNDIRFALEAMRRIKQIDPHILVEHAAGINTGEQVYRSILAGVDAVGAASGVSNAPDPCAVAEEMIRSVRRALSEHTDKA